MPMAQALVEPLPDGLADIIRQAEQHMVQPLRVATAAEAFGAGVLRPDRDGTDGGVVVFIAGAAAEAFAAAARQRVGAGVDMAPFPYALADESGAMCGLGILAVHRNGAAVAFVIDDRDVATRLVEEPIMRICVVSGAVVHVTLVDMTPLQPALRLHLDVIPVLAMAALIAAPQSPEWDALGTLLDEALADGMTPRVDRARWN